MSEKELKKKNNYFGRTFLFLFFILIMGAGILYCMNEIILEDGWNNRHLMLSGLIFFLLILYSLFEHRKLFVNTRSLIFALCCFLISGLLLILPDVYINFPLWLFGGILAAALFNRNIGLLYVYFFVLQAAFLQSGNLRGLIAHFMIATVICIFIPKMKTWISMLYLMAVTCAVTVTAVLVLNKLQLGTDFLLDSIWLVIVYLLCILVVRLLQILFASSFINVKETEQENDKAEIAQGYQYLAQVAVQTEQPYDTGNVQELHEVNTNPTLDFSKYCDEKADLLQQLKNRKHAAYIHSLLVGKLSGEAAEQVNANITYAKAIGYYHEIGKIKEGKSTEQTLSIAVEEGFPQELINALSSFDIKNSGLINNKETAIVMLTDTILTTYFYLRNNKNITTTAEKIVESTIGMRVTRGNLDRSNLAIADCTRLRDFYVKQLQAQDERRGIIKQEKT